MNDNLNLSQQVEILSGEPVEKVKDDAIDLSKIDPPAKTKEDKPITIEELQAQMKAMQQSYDEKYTKLKASYDKTATEAATLKSKVKEAKEAAAVPNEELEKAKAELLRIQRDNQKRDLTISLAENNGLSTKHTTSIVQALYDEEINDINHGKFQEALSELIKAVKIQVEENLEREIAAGRKPKNTGASSDDSLINEFMKGAGVI